MGVTRKIPVEISELDEKARGGAADDPKRFAAARFTVRVTPAAPAAEQPAEASEE